MFLLDPSVIQSGPVSKVVLEGRNFTLHCNATGKPTPNITWTKDGNPTVLYQGETYSIVNIQRQAAGDYTCTAWNGVGTKANASATVAVHCKCLYCTYNISQNEYNLSLTLCGHLVTGAHYFVSNKNS